MEHCKRILEASLLWRLVNALCLWTGRQWQGSAVVRWFLNPAPWGQKASETSFVFRLWSLLRSGLSRLYTALKLDRLFDGMTGDFLTCLVRNEKMSSEEIDSLKKLLDKVSGK